MITRPLLILDRQHAGKRRSPTDPGAVYDLDGDGVTGENGEREIDLTLLYGAHAVDAIHRAGDIDVELLGWPGQHPMEYRERADAANRLARVRVGAPCLYVALHVNAGGGKGAIVEYDARSEEGALAAAALLSPLKALAQISAKGSATRALVAGGRGFVCLSHVYDGPANLCAALYEPGFIDSPEHADLWTSDGLNAIGNALAEGARAYLLDPRHRSAR